MNSGEAAQGVQIALAECTQGELARQDAKLNEVYQFVMDHNADEQRAEIRDAERAWIAHRDQKCVYDEGGGSNAALEQLTCKTNETIRRRQSLENRQ